MSESRALPFTAGGRVGPYELLSRIGAGGMGEVFRGRDARVDRPVAIKLLWSARDAHPKQLERFISKRAPFHASTIRYICTLSDVGSKTASRSS